MNKLLAVNKGGFVLDKIKSIFRKKSNDSVSLDQLWALLSEEKYDEVLMNANKITSSLNKVEAKDAAKLSGMALFRMGRYAEAVPYFQLATNYNAEVNDWFNVVTSATLSRSIETGRNAFERAKELQIQNGHTQQPSLPAMYSYYACALRDVGEFELAFEQIEVLRSIYEQLVITDSTFLYMRGVPFLSHTMEVAVGVFKGLGSCFDAAAWLDSFSSKLDEDGQEYLREFKLQYYS